MAITVNPKADVPAPKKQGKPEARVTYVQKVIGNDTYLVMAASAIELEDEFNGLYYTSNRTSNVMLMPPFEPKGLLHLVTVNNVLAQCVETMEVNIDGTGHDFDPAEPGKDIDPVELKVAESFFAEPYPNTSFMSMRRRLRREVESVGYGYLEVLRNVQGDVVGVRNVDTHNVRFVKLDMPVMVTKTVTRNGKDVSMQLIERERRFAQRVGVVVIYYREYGSSRQLNRNTGRWEDDQNPVPAELRATELLVFGVHPDILTPYYLPRWINQMPSVIGSRKAEEQNLEFLDSGGLPPAIIFVQGGTLAGTAAEQLRGYLSGKNKNKNRAVVVEVQSSSGSLDAAGSVQVRVERFGGERANDALYQNFDKNTEEHVRVGFRLPPLFLGRAQDYNFATAYTAYMVAEAQVFGPERAEFDEKMNMTLIKELKLKTLRFRSNPINIKDITNAISIMQLVKDMTTRESFVEEANTLTGMALEMAEDPQPDSVSATYTAPGAPALQGGPGAPPVEPSGSVKQPKPPTVVVAPTAANDPNAKPTAPAKDQKPAKTAVKKSARELIDLANEYAALKGLIRKREVSPEQRVVIEKAVDALEDEDRRAFNDLLAAYTFGHSTPDLVNLTAQACEHLHG